MNEENMRHKIYLAGLLHDIGKFYQRADEAEDFNSSFLNQSVKENATNVSPVTQHGWVKYAHSAYTQQFLENSQSIFNGLFNDKSDKEDNFINLAIHHHKPNTFLQEIIQMADWWSSGIDRQKQYEKQEIEKDYRKRSLINIFKNLKVYKFDKDTKEYKDLNTSTDNFNFSLNKLSLEREVIFSHSKTNTSQEAYKNLWDNFINDFKKIPTKDFRYFADSLYYVLQSYLWCIPASTLKDEVHDSNLFEHSKTTAAIALCLYDYYCEKQISDVKNLNKDHRPVSLVSINISGIQSFIYNISSKGAAKALKGRSFYLQLLMDTIINEILYDLEYYRSNVLYSSGGKAYLLLPNIERVNTGLKNYQENLERWLFEKFNGDLYVSIGKVAFFFDKDKRDDEGNRGKKYLLGKDNKYHFLGDLWKAALDDVSNSKNQRFKSVIKNDEKFFEPFGEGGDIEVCDLTGVELDNKNKFLFDKCKFHVDVGEQIELGRILKHATYFVWTNSKEQPDIVINNSLFNFKNQIKSLRILNSQWLFFDVSNVPSSIDNATIYKSVSDELDFISETISGNSVKAFRFYAGATEIGSFEELLDKESDFKRLAAFVMDVDNLGKIFVEGFKEKDKKGELIRDNSSLSRLSTLSFYLDLFFSGYINKLKEKYEKVMVVYSGGDDLLAVGDWKEILAFAEDIRNEFHEFVCNRSEISFSAGIHLFTEKYPISKAVKSAKDSESVAKKYNNCAKGNITLLNTPVIWKKLEDNEFDKVKKLKNQMIELFDKDLINSAFIQKFQTFYEVKKQNENAQIENIKSEEIQSEIKGDLSYRWNTAYYFKRYESRFRNKKDNEQLFAFLNKAYDDLKVFVNGAKIDLFVNERNYDLYALAARWAELEIRSRNN